MDATYTASRTGNPIKIDFYTLDEAKKAVADGLRNEAQANVAMPDGRTAIITNHHGKAVLRYIS